MVELATEAEEHEQFLPEHDASINVNKIRTRETMHDIFNVNISADSEMAVENQKRM